MWWCAHLVLLFFCFFKSLLKWEPAVQQKNQLWKSSFHLSFAFIPRSVKIPLWFLLKLLSFQKKLKFYFFLDSATTQLYQSSLSKRKEKKKPKDGNHNKWNAIILTKGQHMLNQAEHWAVKWMAQVFQVFSPP